MAHQLSWDLHVHPGPSSVTRWGSVEEIRAAAARAGIQGFVWKSHERHTARAARDLPPDGPHVIGSASLNGWAAPDDVWGAILDGARWVWGPTRASGQGGDWDLDLPDWWPVLLEGLPRTDAPLVFATGHLGARGRVRMADAAVRRGHVCSVTHALFLDPVDVPALLERECRFELDLYTAVHDVRGRPRPALADALMRLREQGARAYLTSDAGQAAVGDPYFFSARILGELSGELGGTLVHEAAVLEPDALIRATSPRPT